MTEKLPESNKSDSSKDSEDQKRDSITQDIIPEEILEAIPEEERGKVVSIIRQSMFSAVMKRSNPIADKITGDHITKIIDNSNEQDKRDREDKKGQRNYNLLLIIIGLVFVGFLVVFLQKDQELLIKIIIAIISFVGGFGLGKSTSKKK